MDILCPPFKIIWDQIQVPRMSTQGPAWFTEAEKAVQAKWKIMKIQGDRKISDSIHRELGW